MGALCRPANGDYSTGVVAIEPGQLKFAKGNPLRCNDGGLRLLTMWDVQRWNVRQRGFQHGV